MIEIQVRTSFQHLWAEFSEKLSDQIDKDLKYGAGPQQFREMLADLSYLVAEYEDLMRTQLQQEKALADHLGEQKAHLAASKARVEDGLGRLRRLFEDLSAKLGKAKQ